MIGDIDGSIAASVVALLFGSAALAIYLSSRRRVTTVVGLAVLALSAFFSIALYAEFGYIAPDARVYDDQARAVLSSWTDGAVDQASLYTGKEGWPNLLAAAYSIVGPNTYIGLALNACFLAGCAVLVWKIAWEISKKTEVATCAALLVLNPAMLFWGGLLLREAGMWFFVLLAAYGVIRSLKSTRSLASMLAILVGLVGAYSFRSSVAIPLGIAILVVILVAGRINLFGKVIAVGAAFSSMPIVLSYIERSNLVDEDRLEASQLELAGAASGFGEGGILPSPALVGRVIAGPFPWEIPSLGLQYGVDWLIWIGIVLFALIGTRKNFESAALWLLCLTLLFALVLTSGNYGTMVRLRITGMVFLLPLAGNGLIILASRSRRIVNPADSWSVRTASAG